MPYSLEDRSKGLSEVAFTEKESLYYRPYFVHLSKGFCLESSLLGRGLWIIEVCTIPSDISRLCLAFSTDERNQTSFYLFPLSEMCILKLINFLKSILT